MSKQEIQLKDFNINKWHSKLDEDLLIQCMRCGLCLATCPTYSLTHMEKDSPRGRLALMWAVKNGEVIITNGYADAINLCLGCLACETACPAGVQYGHLLEEARDEIEYFKEKKRNPIINRFRKWLINNLLRGPHGLEKWMPLLRFYQSTGIQELNITKFLPGPVGDWEQMLPKIPKKSAHEQLKSFLPGEFPKKGKIGLLIGCLENTLLANMCVATARILVKNGYDVFIPADQECCGALPGHIGDLAAARARAKKNIEVFERANVDFVISDAAGCSAQLKDYGHMFKDDPLYRERAEKFSSIAFDATEFLAEMLPWRGKLKSLNLRVAYDDPCHLVHAQGISSQPRTLLESIPGIELVELPESDWCCGSAGTYNLTHPKESEALLTRKMNFLKEASVDVLVTSNTGCYLQLAAGVRKHRLNVKVLHITEIIYLAYIGI